MRASLNWIKELLPTLKATPAGVEKRLTAAGLEVEATEREADSLPGVVAAEVRTCARHPDADKLSVCTVFDGEKEHHVVCGAPNVRAGMKAAFAPVGTTLPNGLTLEPRKIRGQPSEGMLCAEDELGLGDDHGGIMELKPRTRPGKPLVEVLKLNDTLFELGVTPNRPDVLSHHGLARELAAIHGLPLPKVSARVRETGPRAEDSASVSVVVPDVCPKYVARVITGVKVGPSSPEVQRRLRAVGQRPISNVVDATNIVLLELGHPLHAFDLRRLEGQQIRVRMAAQGEKIELLDGSTKALTEGDLVIADENRPVALAGVMGGANSEVHDETVDILLEAAVFDPSAIRRTARRHGLHTEASHRFERGVDLEMVEAAADRCAQLIVEAGGGVVHKGRVAVATEPAPAAPVAIRAERASRLIGRPVDNAEIRQTLKALGLQAVRPKPEELPKDAPDKALWFRAPSWRVDLSIEEDLIEEVGRLHGYDDLTPQMPPRAGAVWTEAPAVEPEAAARARLVGLGFYEAISLAFNSRAHAEAMGADLAHAVGVANPLGEQSQLMRTSLLPALLEAARLNQDNLPSVTDLRLFEIGRTFAWTAPPTALPEQPRRIGLLMRGRRYPKGWTADDPALDAYDLKGALEALFESFSADVAYASEERPWLHPRSATTLRLDGVEIGAFGEAHPDLMARFGLEGPPVFLAEVDLDPIAAQLGRLKTFKPLTKTPPAQRDLSFFVSKDVPSAAVVAAAQGADEGGILEEVDIFDVYEGQGVPEGERSMAIALTFRASGRTLTDQEVEAAQNRVEQALEGLGARVRRG